MEAPRSARERKVADVLENLRMVPGTEKDIWVASASAAGEAYLIPLTFYWDGTRLTVCNTEEKQNGPESSTRWCSARGVEPDQGRDDYRGDTRIHCGR
jgi:hypothetical protein